MNDEIIFSLSFPFSLSSFKRRKQWENVKKRQEEKYLFLIIHHSFSSFFFIIFSLTSGSSKEK